MSHSIEARELDQRFRHVRALQHTRLDMQIAREIQMPIDGLVFLGIARVPTRLAMATAKQSACR